MPDMYHMFVWLSSVRNLARHRQTDLPDGTADDTSLRLTHYQYTTYWALGGAMYTIKKVSGIPISSWDVANLFYSAQKPAETQTINQLASSLISAPNSWTRGHEFESPAGPNLAR